MIFRLTHKLSTKSRLELSGDLTLGRESLGGLVGCACSLPVARSASS